MAILIILLLPQIIFGLTDSNNVIGAQFESQKSENELKFEHYENGVVANHLNSKIKRNEGKIHDHEGKGEIDEKKISERIEEGPKIAQVEKIEPRAMWMPLEKKEIERRMEEGEARSESEDPETAHEMEKIEPRAMYAPEIEGKGAQQGISSDKETLAFCNSQVIKCFKYKLNSELFGKTCEKHCVENINCTSFAIRTAVNGKKLEKGSFCFLAVDKCPKGFMPFNTETKRGIEECENSTFGLITPMKPRTKTAKVLAFGNFFGQRLWAINMWTAKKIALPLAKSSPLALMNFTIMFPHLAFLLWIFMYFIGWKICFTIAKKIFWFLWNYGGPIATWIWNNPKLALAGFAVIGSGAYLYFPTLLSLSQALGAFMMMAFEFLKDLFGKHVKDLGEELRKFTGEKAINCPPLSCANGSGLANKLKLTNANLEQQMKALSTELGAANIEVTNLTEFIKYQKQIKGNFFHNILGRLGFRTF